MDLVLCPCPFLISGSPNSFIYPLIFQLWCFTLIGSIRSSHVTILIPAMTAEHRGPQPSIYINIKWTLKWWACKMVEWYGRPTSMGYLRTSAKLSISSVFIHMAIIRWHLQCYLMGIIYEFWAKAQTHGEAFWAIYSMGGCCQWRRGVDSLPALKVDHFAEVRTYPILVGPSFYHFVSSSI